MTKSFLLSIALMFVITISKAQTAMQFSGVDCNSNPVDLFADLDAGKAVILHFYMPSCGSCPPPAQKIQAMANKINAMYPGMVKGYAFPFQNSTTCTYSSSWVSSNSLSTLYAPMDSGATQVAYYGGFGMPTVVLLGGTDHRVMFSTQSFSTSDTTIMRDSILNLLNGSTGIEGLTNTVSSFSMFPNPATDNVSINLDLKETSNLLISVTDITGKQVTIILEEKQNGNVTKQFSTALLPNGNYFIRVQVNGNTTTQKLTINH
ncbi:MAG: T9SS type A sorting domain-containing protein [Bacteroidia bacterium]|nr:T9SS type A sorting domain-containing protein [Bacteroidia bacterium]